jgi:hypothetical protein
VLLNKEKALLSHVFSKAVDGWSSYESKLANAFTQLVKIERAYIVRNHGEEQLEGLSGKLKMLLSKFTHDIIDNNGTLVGVGWWNGEWGVQTDLEKHLYASVATSKEDPLLEKANCEEISNLVTPFIQQGALSEYGQGADPVLSQHRDMVLDQLRKWGESHK